MKFVIVNTVDKPCERLVAQIVGDRAFYLNPELRPNYPGMCTDRSTDLETFGFVINVIEGTAYFERMKPSTATYADGEPRRWQGEDKFFLPVIEEDGEVS